MSSLSVTLTESRALGLHIENYSSWLRVQEALKCKRRAGEEEKIYFEVGHNERKRNEGRLADVTLPGSERAEGINLERIMRVMNR